MELRLTFAEISELIEKKAGRPLPVMYGGPHTVRVSYDVNVLFKSASVGIDLTVDQIVDSDIYLSFNGGAGIDFMVRQAVNMAKSRPGRSREVMGTMLASMKIPKATYFLSTLLLDSVKRLSQPPQRARRRFVHNRDFADALSLLDDVCIVDIYPAREEPIPGVTSALIYDNLRPGIRRQMCTKDGILDVVRQGGFDVLVTLGAGDIEDYVQQITDILRPLS